MAEWTTSYINDLPDSSFLHIQPGGTKDSAGKTVPRSLRMFPVKDSGGTIDLAHLRNALARIPQSNLPGTTKDTLVVKAQRLLENANKTASVPDTPMKDNLIRGQWPADFDLRDTGDGMPTMSGHFAVFNEWTEINSWLEGRFLERIKKGAFKKTFDESKSQIRVLLEHGKHPSVGNSPLGVVEELREEDQGAYYEVPLIDTSYNRDLIPALAAGAYGASFRFKVMQEQLVQKPERSDFNPDGLPERTITEARVMEFGPVTFPAYAGATAGLRSLTGDFVEQHLLGMIGGDPDRLRAILDVAGTTAEPEPNGAATPLNVGEPEPAATTPSKPTRRRFRNQEEWSAWLQLTNSRG